MRQSGAAQLAADLLTNRLTGLTLEYGLEFRMAALIGTLNMNSIGIGTLAKRAGVRIDTVRYYERAGLLSPKARLASGYRRYGELELARLRFIRRAQALGFTLKEVRELLVLSNRRDVARVKRAAQEKLADVEQRIAALERVRKGLVTLVAVCPGHGRAADCPILNALGGESLQ